MDRLLIRRYWPGIASVLPVRTLSITKTAELLQTQGRIIKSFPDDHALSKRPAA